MSQQNYFSCQKLEFFSIQTIVRHCNPIIILMLSKLPTRQLLIVELIKHYASFACDGCQRKIKNPQCKSCQKMINYFNVFNIPQQYKIDQKLISLKAKQLQKQFHPDKNLQQLDHVKNGLYSAYINDAKTTLLDDLKRAVYLMELNGININQQTKIHDAKFMEDMYELQQEIDDANEQQATKIAKRIQIILKQLQNNLNQFFQSKDLQKCKQFVYKYKYLNKAMQNSIKKIQNIASSH